MAYELRDANGYVSYGPSVAGMKALREEVESLPAGAYPELTKFVTTGSTRNPADLANEAVRASDKIENTAVRRSLINIIASARKAVSYLVLAG